MKILAIDTSSRFLSIALGNGRDIIKEENYLLERRHSSLLIPKIKEMLEGLDLSVNEIDAFVVGLGPGSFTGLRIGVSAVKGLGLALKKPCIGVASIDAIALGIGTATIFEPKMVAVPIIDAKRENVYSAIYEKKNGRVVRKTGYLLIKIDELLKKIKKEVIFLGDGIIIYRDKIDPPLFSSLQICQCKSNRRDRSKTKQGGLRKSLASYRCKAIFLKEKYWYPRAGNLIKLALPKIKRSKKCNLAKLEPIYLYPKDCQVKR